MIDKENRSPSFSFHLSPVKRLLIALTTLATGGLCFLAPAYFDATSRQRTVWLFAGIMLSILGALFTVVHIDLLKGRRKISEAGFAAVMFIGAITTWVLSIQGGRGPWGSGPLKTMALFEFIFAVGAAIWASLAPLRKPPHSVPFGSVPRRRWDRLLVGIIALLAAALNLVAGVFRLRS